MKFLILVALLVGSSLADDAGNPEGFVAPGVDWTRPEDIHGDDADPDDNGSDVSEDLLLEVPPGKLGASSSNESQVVLQQVDSLCYNDNNLAVFGTPSGSGGGTGAYGPSNMNDEKQCEFYWPTGSAPSIQYTWSERHLVSRFVIRTDPYCAGGSCTSHGVGRGVASGTVQYWNGYAWITHGSFTRSSPTIYYYFTNCIRTNAIRIINLRTHNCGQQNNPVIYEWSVCECNLHACGTSTNLARFATPSASSGGSSSSDYGVSNLNDLKQCLWFWTSGNNGWIQYYWQTPVYVRQFKLYTDPRCQLNKECSEAQAGLGRGVRSGTVQWWNGSSWVTDGYFTSNSEIITYTMRYCVNTRYLRVQNIAAHNCTGGQNNNPVMYEWQVCSC